MSDLDDQIVDILVIGAGPAGSISASILSQKGYKVKIVEKQVFPRFVIGESLLPKCMENFEKAGFIEAIEKGGFQKKFGAKFIKGKQSCQFDFSEQFTDGYTWTWQVQRAKFDNLLAEEVVRKGTTVEFGSSLTDVEFKENGTSISRISRSDGTTYSLEAKYLIDGSGYGRVIPKLLSLDKESDFPPRASLFCHVLGTKKLKRDEEGQILVIVHSTDMWIWIIPFADGTHSLGVVGDTTIIDRFHGSPEEKMKQLISETPELKVRFQECEILFPPRSITGYAKGIKKHFGKNFVLTGNSAEFIDPIFSSGVTFATESGVLAAELIHKQLSGEYVDWQREYSDYIQSGVDVFKTFVESWYDGSLQKIFFSNSSNDVIRKQICSVLAGYVWDQKNPFIRKHKRAIQALSAVLQ